MKKLSNSMTSQMLWALVAPAGILIFALAILVFVLSCKISHSKEGSLEVSADGVKISYILKTIDRMEKDNVVLKENLMRLAVFFTSKDYLDYSDVPMDIQDAIPQKILEDLKTQSALLTQQQIQLDNMRSWLTDLEQENK